MSYMSRSVTFRLPDELFEAVTKACERRKIGLSTFMVQAVREAMPQRPHVIHVIDPTPLPMGVAEPRSPTMKVGDIITMPDQPPHRITGLITGPKRPKPGSLLKKSK
jgi:hypothetical protein